MRKAAKLAFADRSGYYADPDFLDVPMEALLSDEYNDARRKLIDPAVASGSFIPGLAARRPSTLLKTNCPCKLTTR